VLLRDSDQGARKAKGFAVGIAKPFNFLVPEAGLEPACPCGRQILSLLCLPFHHSGRCWAIIANGVWSVKDEKGAGQPGRDEKIVDSEKGVCYKHVS
jgi:hypothetical protein